MTRCLHLALPFVRAAAISSVSQTADTLASLDHLVDGLADRALKEWSLPSEGLHRTLLAKPADMLNGNDAAHLLGILSEERNQPRTMSQVGNSIPAGYSNRGGSGIEFCPDEMQAVFADIHDGDMKEVSISGKSMTIKPCCENNENWVVTSEINQMTCSSTVDFNVPGKPNAPPVSLTATLWSSATDAGTVTVKKTEFGFTDPSGQMAPPGFPLNRWVQLGVDGQMRSDACPKDVQYVYQDIKDGDMKVVSIRDGKMLITPFQIKPGESAAPTWRAEGIVDSESCSAIIDFNVKGKMNPPPVKLKATLIDSYSMKEKLTEIEFTDPSGTLASQDFPLNHWVQIAKAA